jgi:hypothetical protein
MEPRGLDFSQLNMLSNAPTGTGISSAHTGGRAHIALADGDTRFLDAPRHSRPFAPP